jgi:enoyl-[acyl-carrier protein] reductase II
MLIDRLFKVGREFLGCKYPIMCGAMTIEFGKLQLELLNKLDNQIIDLEEAQFEVERFLVGALRDAAVDGNIVKASIMAGQSVGLVSEIKPLKSIIDEMVVDAENELQQVKHIID